MVTVTVVAPLAAEQVNAIAVPKPFLSLAAVELTMV